MVILGSELAKKLAKEVSTIVTNTIFFVPFLSSIQVISEMIREDPPTQVYHH